MSKKKFADFKKMTTFALPFEKEGVKRTDSVAQLVEHNTFNVGVLGSNPSGITGKKSFTKFVNLFFVFVSLYS